MIDKIINFISPSWGLKRAESRMRLKASEAWEGSSKRRIVFENYNPSTNDLNDDIFNELPTLRNHCADLIRNNALAAGVINTKVTSVVGAGLKMKPVIDDSKVNISEYSELIEDEFTLWANDRYECDGFAELTFAEAQDLFFRTILAQGDCFIRFGYFKNSGCKFKFKFYLISPDRVSNPNNQSNNDYLKNGIKYDKKTGRAIGFYFSTGKTSKTWQFQPYLSPSGRVLAIHGIFRKTIGQSRGIPDIANIIVLLKQLGDFTDAYLQKAIVSAILSVFVKTEDGMGMQGLGTSTVQNKIDRYQLGSGTVMQGSVEDDIEIIESSTPSNTFDPFILSIIRQIGIATEVPYEILVKHFTSSYTAAQASFLEAWRYFKHRREILANTLCLPVYRAWFESAVFENILPFDDFLFADKRIKNAYTACEWIGEPQGHIDQLKSNKADAYAQDMGWVSGSYNAAIRGQNWQKVNIKRQQEQEFLKSKGLYNEQSN